LEGRLFSRPFHLCNFEAKRFIRHSQNKTWWNRDVEEHHPSRFVVGAGNEKVRREFHD
jgi:hypothetical protein